MKNNTTCLITDPGTDAYMKESMPLHEKAFDHIVVTPIEKIPNTRVNHDSPYYTFNSQFTNHNKDQIFQFSPYDKTLLIDIDFMVANNLLDQIFDSNVYGYPIKSIENLKEGEYYVQAFLHKYETFNLSSGYKVKFFNS